MLRTLAFALLASLSFVACAVDPADDPTEPTPTPITNGEDDDEAPPDDGECASLDDSERHDCPE